MASMTPEDLHREVRAVFAMRDAGDLDSDFCGRRRGMNSCDRHHRHHGKHAQGVGVQQDPKTRRWYATRVVCW